MRSSLWHRLSSLCDQMKHRLESLCHDAYDLNRIVDQGDGVPRVSVSYLGGIFHAARWWG